MSVTLTLRDAGDCALAAILENELIHVSPKPFRIIGIEKYNRPFL